MTDEPIYSIKFNDDEPINVTEWACLTYILFPSDIPNVWVGHCLEVNVVSQSGISGGAEGALQSTLEATAIIIEMDKRAKLDPFERIAPEEHWPPERLEHWKTIRKICADNGAQTTWKGYDPVTKSFINKDAEENNDDDTE